LFQDIHGELCDHAVKQGWVSSKTPDKIVRELRESVAPVFVPLDVLPDSETLHRLRQEFPRMLFLAPRPSNRATLAGDELLPDPPPERERAEYHAWQLAKNAIENG
jgi:hypothetical protein